MPKKKTNSKVEVKESVCRYNRIKGMPDVYQIRVRPHNDMPGWFVVERHRYDWDINSPTNGEPIEEVVCHRDTLMLQMCRFSEKILDATDLYYKSVG